MMTPIRAWLNALEEMLYTILISMVPLMAFALFFNCYMGDLHEFSTIPKSFITMMLVLAGDYDAEAMFAESSFNDPIPLGSIFIAIIRLFIVMAFTNILIVVVLERYTTAKQDAKDVHPHFDYAMTEGGLRAVRHCCCCLSKTAYETLESKLEKRLSRSKQDITIKKHEHHTDECDDYRKVTKKFIRYELMQLYKHIHEDALQMTGSSSRGPQAAIHGPDPAPAPLSLSSLRTTAEGAAGGGAVFATSPKYAGTVQAGRSARAESPDLSEDGSSEIDVVMPPGFEERKEENDIAVRSVQLVRLSQAEETALSATLKGTLQPR